MEEHIEGAQVGPTVVCLMVDQFIALRKGDRFYYENVGVFTHAQLKEVRTAGLAKIICNVMEGMKETTKNPLVRKGAIIQGKSRNSIISCDSLGDIDLSAWRDGASGGDNSTPRPATTAPDPDLPAFLCRPCDPSEPEPCGPREPEHLVCGGFGRCVCEGGWSDFDADPRNGCEGHGSKSFFRIVY